MGYAMRNRPRPSKFVQQLTRQLVKPLVDQEAAEVRGLIDGNLLLARMCCETGNMSNKALGALIVPLRAVMTVAHDLGNEPLQRIIAGFETPLQSMIDRCLAGGTTVSPAELAPMNAVITAVLDALPTLPDAQLVLAYNLAELYRLKAAEQMRRAPREQEGAALWPAG